MLPEIIMVQPRTSLTGSFIRMLPLGLLYASSKVVKKGFPVHILDTRLNPSSWQKELNFLINDKTLVVGISVMSGVSIRESIEISRYVKRFYPKVYVVWGGPHPTFSPEDVLQESSVDFSISGYAAESFYQLILNLSQDKQALTFSQIPGLSWRDHKKNIYHNEILNEFEFIHYKDIPYQLIKNFADYRHTDGKVVFSMYSVMGCPYKCAFCSSPAHYGKFKRKWQPYPIEDVVLHIKMAQDKHGAELIYFIDDDSFVDLKHVEGIIDEVKRAGIRIDLAFRGARIDEILKMSDGFLEKLVYAGTRTMHIGAESGSDRILKLMNKNITASQILEANMKLARYPQIRIFYNFIVGFPTETLEETKKTVDLILQLIKENPSCCVIPLNKPRPLPGTELYKLASEYGYVAPDSLEEWGKYDVESANYNPEWLTKEHNKFIRMMFLCMYFIDDKIFKLCKGKSVRLAILKALAWIYKPIAMFRFKNGIYQFLIEDKIYGIFCLINNW